MCYSKREAHSTAMLTAYSGQVAAGAGDPGLGGDAAGFDGEGGDEEDMEREAPELLEPPERRCAS